MSAPPFFQSAGRGDLLFWGVGEGPTVVTHGRAYQNKKRQVGWKRQARCTTGSCGAGQKKGRRKSAHLSSARKKSFLTTMQRNRKMRRTKEEEPKEGISRAERTIQVIVEARQHQIGNERGSRFMPGSKKSHCHGKTNSGPVKFVDSSKGVGRNGRMSSTTDRYQVRILDEHRDWQIRRLRLLRHSHSLAAGDGSNRKGGEMGAGYVQLKKRRKRQQRKVGREEVGSSSKRPELAAFVF